MVDITLPKPEQPSSTDPHRGFGYVEFEIPADAKEAIENMDQSELFGRVIKVAAAKPQKESNEGLGSKTAVWEQVCFIYYFFDIFPTIFFLTNLPSLSLSPLLYDKEFFFYSFFSPKTTRTLYVFLLLLLLLLFFNIQKKVKKYGDYWQLTFLGDCFSLSQKSSRRDG